jgi:isopentenyldiphosphate isomerase
MSKITIVNEQDIVIGSEERNTVTEKKLIRRIVRILCVNSEGKYLLQLRSKTKNIFPSTYDQSVGGHVEENEEYLAAGVREAKEELGLDITQDRLEEVAHFYCEETYKDIYIREFNKLYLLHITNEKLLIEEDEVSDVEWKSEAEINDLFLNHIEMLSGGFRVAWVEYQMKK